MSARRSSVGGDSPYVAFKDDRERRWALVSRDVRLVLIVFLLAIGESAALKWPTVWHLVIGG
jgi:hypothetical protein